MLDQVELSKDVRGKTGHFLDCLAFDQIKTSWSHRTKRANNKKEELVAHRLFQYISCNTLFTTLYSTYSIHFIIFNILLCNIFHAIYFNLWIVHIKKQKVAQVGEK